MKFRSHILEDFSKSSNGNSATCHPLYSPISGLSDISDYWKNHFLLCVFWVIFSAYDCFLPPRDTWQCVCHLLFFCTSMDYFLHLFFLCKGFTIEVGTWNQFAIWYKFHFPFIYDLFSISSNIKLALKWRWVNKNLNHCFTRRSNLVKPYANLKYVLKEF